jgi:hypothetical protein
MNKWVKKFLFWRESLKRNPTDRKVRRTERQQLIRNKKIQMAKDLSIGHNLGEFNLDPNDFWITMRILSGKMVSWHEIEKMFKKYR